MKFKLSLSFLIYLSFFGIITSQTKNQNLNYQLGLMRKYFLEKNYTKYAEFVYPKVYELLGGKSRMIQVTRNSVNKMEQDGFNFIDLKFKSPSKFINFKNQIQFTITEKILMQTPKGKILAAYTMIGISEDQGKTWKFIDTSGKSKEMIRHYFPNLSKDLIIKAKTQKNIN
ncbi:hypothetical protein [Chryseobacterium salviniae]|uniref:DUF4136 domain-containing protein n=1 Tax=Chryseobacterium salviniae TaxID=3101750 RepID=A0ABU6HPS5_9FLAO|nr:hypothetical protein [Chryseobacterium sp. T9W2-O]MEC3875046.1 hypothetical protein [Chryseobacterium sp. T9W2-O]